MFLPRYVWAVASIFFRTSQLGGAVVLRLTAAVEACRVGDWWETPLTVVGPLLPSRAALRVRGADSLSAPCSRMYPPPVTLLTGVKHLRDTSR